MLQAGYGALTDWLARDLSIQLNTPIDHIEWHGAGVRLQGAHGRIEAAQVLVTVPLGVLKAGRLQFSPALPGPQQQAIDGLGMGLLDKLCLRFDAAFWPEHADWLQVVADPPGEWAEWVSLSGSHRQPVLIGFNAAEAAQRNTALSDEALLAAAMARLRGVFGSDIPAPVSQQRSRWGADPYSLGSYSYLPVGSTPALRSRLAQSFSDRLFLAGEHTHRQHAATAHGAYLSGLRAAVQILAAQPRLPPLQRRGS